MRARTRRLRSLLRGIVNSPLDTPQSSPQQRTMVSQRTDETNPGVCPPLPLAGLRLGRSLKRLGADRRRYHHGMSEQWRQGISVAAGLPTAKVAPSQSSGSADSSSHGFDVPNGPHCDATGTRPWDLGCNPHRFVHVFGFDQVEAREELLGLGEWPVDNGQPILAAT